MIVQTAITHNCHYLESKLVKGNENLFFQLFYYYDSNAILSEADLILLFEVRGILLKNPVQSIRNLRGKTLIMFTILYISSAFICKGSFLPFVWIGSAIRKKTSIKETCISIMVSDTGLKITENGLINLFKFLVDPVETEKFAM